MDTKTQLKLLDIATCPFCFKRLHEARFCTSGHTVCAECWNKTNKCPTCSAGQSQGNFMLKQILEVLPETCCHKGCSEVGEDHDKKWCGCRVTNCRGQGCTWKGRVNQLQEHVKQNHRLCSIDELKGEVGVHMTATEQTYTFTVVAHGHMFWLIRKYSPQSKIASYEILWVPNGEIYEDQFKFKIEFRSDNRSLVETTKIKFDPDNQSADLNRLIFHVDTLKYYKVDDFVPSKIDILKPYNKDDFVPPKINILKE